MKMSSESRSRLLIAALVAAVAWWCLPVQNAVAQTSPSPGAPPAEMHSPLPDHPDAASGLPAKADLPKKPDDGDAAEAKIRRALRGESVDDGGNEMLGDVLDVLRRRGSVLEGSSLDPDADVLRRVLPDRESTGDSSGHETRTGDRDRVSSVRPNSNSSDADLQAAEALLRAARLLEQTETRSRSVQSVQSEGQLHLARRMRLAAVELLIRWRSQQTGPRPDQSDTRPR